MLGEFWVYLFVILFAVGFAVRNEVLVIIGAIGLVLAVSTWFWSKLAVERLTYRRTLGRHRVFLNEDIPVQMALSNRKRLPIPRVRVMDHFPVEVELVGHPMSGYSGREMLRFTRSTALGSYERVRWNYTLRAKQRGSYRLGPVEVQASDPFGFFRRIRHQPEEEFLLVFPSTVPLPQSFLEAHRPLGDSRGRPWFHLPDPNRPAGVRDYVPGDPTKFIDWKASARRRSLQVKQFEPGSSVLTALFLNADTVGVSYGGVVPLHLERAVAVAASVAEQVLSAGNPIALFTNSRSVLFEHPMRVLPGRRTDQHTLVMETLAMVGPYLAGGMDGLLLEQARQLPAGTTHVLISGMMTQELSHALELLVRMQRGTLVLWVAEWEPEGIPEGVPVFNLAPHLRDVEARGLAPYMAGLTIRRPFVPEARDEVAKEAAAAEQAHLEARDVPMA